MWKDKTEFYTIIKKNKLKDVKYEKAINLMGYDKSKIHTFESACFPFPRELTNGDFLINIQLSHKNHYNNKCVEIFITPELYDLAVEMYGEENIFEDISKLEFKEIE